MEDRAETLIEELQIELDDIKETIGEVEDPINVLWFDSGADDVYAGACCVGSCCVGTKIETLTTLDQL